MSEVILFLSENEIWFYIVLGGFSLFLLFRLFSAIAEWRDAAFGMEREIAVRKFGISLTFLILLFLIALSEFILVSFSESVLPDMASISTPTIDLISTPTVILPAAEITAVVESEITVTPTISQQGCVPDQLEWIYPKPGEELKDVVKLIGTVNIPDFGFYKYEYTEPGNSIWKTIAGGNETHVNEEIGAWNTTQLIPGDYILRLVVLDNENNEYPACLVQVRVINP
jgi:hypothetical protein